MANNEIYNADPKLLKELARGNASLVFLENGIVKWKRTLSSISFTFITETPAPELIKVLDPETGYVIKLLTIPFIALLLLLLVLDRSGKLLTWHLSKRKTKKKAAAEKP